MQQYCSDSIDAKFIFETFKIGRYFSTKDHVPKCLINHVVYHFKCAGCNACYVGETSRHFLTRINEHLFTDKKSAVFKHIHDNNNLSCMNVCDDKCFSILDKAPTKFRLKIKEAAHIKQLGPILNKQVKKVNSYQLKLLV